MSAQSSPYGEPVPGSNYAGSDHQQGPPRKKMRKGTKSCIECRRRKIKCTFETGRTHVCNECFARGSTCIDQEHGDSSLLTATASSTETSSLRDRVSSLEDLVKQVLNRLPERSSPRDGSPEANIVDTQAAEVLKSLRSPSRNGRANVEDSLYYDASTRDSVPTLSLFDNAVLATQDVPPTVSREQYNKARTIIAALHELMLPLSDLEKILESSQEWFAIWKSMFPDLTDRRCVTIKESVSHTLRSEKPAEVGKIMMCIALSIQQLPLSFDWSKTSMKKGPNDVMERYVSTVDKLIVQDEEIAATIDGIECMILMSKWHINMGRPRKSWLLYRRATAFGQMLGLHRLAQRKAERDDHLYQRQIMIWGHLIMGDRFMSLILGLPYAVSEHFVNPAIQKMKEFGKPGTAELYFCDYIPLISKIIDRNQNTANTPYAFTMTVEQEMEDLRSKQDNMWWTTDWIPGATLEEHFERLQAQFYHHMGRVLLHMPFMLKSSTDKRYQFSHSATLESAREMIKYYDALRGTDSVGPHCCKVIDFQAFTAAMLLLLNLCGYSQHARGAPSQQPDLDRDQQDSDLIDRAIHLLKGAANEAGGTVAANSAKALEFLAKVREGCDMNKECPGSIQVSIPYFGTLSITAGKQFVPIKKGTYPDAGTRPQRLPSQTGLPTPPSMASSSAQPSPRESLLSADNTRPSPQWNVPDQSWKNQQEDPFVTFDSFMAFPMGQIDFSTMGSSASSDFMMQPPFLGTVEEQNMAAGFPFPAVSGNVDLDAGWNWFGVGAP